MGNPYAVIGEIANGEKCRFADGPERATEIEHVCYNGSLGHFSRSDVTTSSGRCPHLPLLEAASKGKADVSPAAVSSLPALSNELAIRQLLGMSLREDAETAANDAGTGTA